MPKDHEPNINRLPHYELGTSLIDGDRRIPKGVSLGGHFRVNPRDLAPRKVGIEGGSLLSTTDHATVTYKQLERFGSTGMLVDKLNGDLLLIATEDKPTLKFQEGQQKITVDYNNSEAKEEYYPRELRAMTFTYDPI